MKYIQVEQVFISSVAGDWSLRDCLINKSISIYILSAPEKSDYDVGIHVSPQILLDSSVSP